jgi:thioredoxin 1
MVNEPLVTLTDNNFDAEVIASSQPVLVDFWAPRCGPCRVMTPVIVELAREYAGQVKMGKLDVDDCPRVPTQLAVRAIPTLILFKDGRVVGQIVGAASKPKIDALLKRGLEAR